MLMTLSPSKTRRGKVSVTRKIIGGIFLVIVLWALFLLQTDSIQYFEVESESMEPTLMIGDRLIKIETDDFERDDFVVFHPPDEPETTAVKRLVGMPGDTIVVKNGQLEVNGKPNHPYVHNDDSYPYPPNRTYHLDDGWYFVVGDNRMRSKDSRFYGPIFMHRMLGKVVYRTYPEDRRGDPHQEE